MIITLRWCLDGPHVEHLQQGRGKTLHALVQHPNLLYGGCLRMSQVQALVLWVPSPFEASGFSCIPWLVIDCTLHKMILPSDITL